MSFGFKTTWLAVRDRPASEVADALGLAQTEALPWDEGVQRAYDRGVFVTQPVHGWTLAHGRRDLLTLPYGPVDVGFPAWLTALSRQLGEVQLFANERGWSHHAWTWASQGAIVRAFAISDGALPLFIGAVTPAERELNKGIRTYANDDVRNWGDAEWDAWHATTPDEFDVLRLAGRWSVDPTRIDGSQTDIAGIFGMPGPRRSVEA